MRLQVRLTPKSARDGIDGTARLADGRIILKVRVRAVPEHGAANDALRQLLAKALKLPNSSVQIETGATNRVKTIRLEGNPNDLLARLESLRTELT